MKIAVIGSRTLRVDLESYDPPECTTIVSGGAGGIDTCAAEFAKAKGLALIELLPDYKKDRRGATMQRNLEIIRVADRMLAFWDGQSKGTKHATTTASRLGSASGSTSGTARRSCRGSSESDAHV